MKRITLAVLALLGVLTSGTRVVASSDPVIAAAGDISCDLHASSSQEDADDRSGAGDCKMMRTSDLIASLHPVAVLPLGDEQYPGGAYDSFVQNYAPTWGRFLSITRPAPGNHEYHAQNASGYFRYFGTHAGDPSKGYYSYDIGTWHLIAINANCGHVGGCEKGSPEERWLADDLARSHAACTLAYWHQPRFSSGPHHSDSTYQAFWEDLYAAHADLVLNGHDHDYERFGPQTPTGLADPNGIREIIAGTGGKSHYKFATIEPNSVVHNNTDYGVLAVTLHPHGYDFRFLSIRPGGFSDSGSARCLR